jgi:hypothetical protein
VDVALDDAETAQPRQPVDQRRQIRLRRRSTEESRECVWSARQVEPELGHDAEVGLRKQAVERRAEAVAPEARRACAGVVAVAGAQDLAGAQHRLKPAHLREPIAEPPVAEAALEAVADDAGVAASAGGVEEQAAAARLERLVEVALRDSGLNDGIAELRVHLDDLVHLAEVDDHLAARGRAGIAVAPVAAARDRVQVKPGAACGCDQPAHLFGRVRVHNRERARLCE